jgi:putative addiction module component (TIGR02574 family)
MIAVRQLVRLLRRASLTVVISSDYTANVDRSFEQMTTAERVLYVQALWDRIAADSDEVPLSEAQGLEIRRRVVEHRADPESAVPWEQVLARARAR